MPALAAAGRRLWALQAAHSWTGSTLIVPPASTFFRASLRKEHAVAKQPWVPDARPVVASAGLSGPSNCNEHLHVEWDRARWTSYLAFIRHRGQHVRRMRVLVADPAAEAQALAHAAAVVAVWAPGTRGGKAAAARVNEAARSSARAHAMPGGARFAPEHLFALLERLSQATHVVVGSVRWPTTTETRPSEDAVARQADCGHHFGFGGGLSHRNSQDDGDYGFGVGSDPFGHHLATASALWREAASQRVAAARVGRALTHEVLPQSSAGPSDVVAAVAALGDDLMELQV